MARYLVTGGAGFIGSHLCDALVADGHDVRVLDDMSTGKGSNLPAGVKLIVGDVASSFALEGAGRDLDGIFHLAAIASVPRCNEDYINSHRVNAAGAVNVFELAKQLSIPVVYASSAAVYGLGAENPLQEDAVTAPLSPYGADKLGNELHARAMGHVHGLASCGLRFFNVYGSRQDPSSPYSGVISIFSQRLAARQEISVFGDGQQARDFIHVSDVVRMLRAALEVADRTAPVLNACTGVATTINDLITVLGELSASNPKTVPLSPRPGDIRCSIGDPGLATRELGVSARVRLMDGLAGLIADLRHSEAA